MGLCWIFPVHLRFGRQRDRWRFRWIDPYWSGLGRRGYGRRHGSSRAGDRRRSGGDELWYLVLDGAAGLTLRMRSRSSAGLTLKILSLILLLLLVLLHTLISWLVLAPFRWLHLVRLFILLGFLLRNLLLIPIGTLLETRLRRPCRTVFQHASMLLVTFLVPAAHLAAVKLELVLL